MAMKIASMKNEMPSSAKPTPNTSPNVAMKFGHSRPNSNDRIVPVTTPTAKIVIATFDHRFASALYVTSPVRRYRPSTNRIIAGNAIPNQTIGMCTASDSACIRRARIASGPPAPPRAPETRSAASVRRAASGMRGRAYPSPRDAEAPARPLPWRRMPDRPTERAVAEAAPLETARRAAGPRGAGSQDPLVSELRRAGLLPLLVLHFLAREPSYGTRLMERVTELTGGLIAVNPNTMYPLLRSLEQQGLVRGEWEHPERRSRRFYRLTPAGEAARDRLAVELGPRLDAVAAGIDLIRRELHV